MVHSDWIKLIEEYKESGQTQAKWCESKGIKLKAFSNHMRKYKKANTKAGVKSVFTKPSGSNVRFIELQANPKESQLTINIGKISIDVKTGYDEKLLKEVIKTLVSVC